MKKDTLVLVHLSDIHFNKEYSGTKYDLDEDLRNELEIDVVSVCSRLNGATGILITGDIAFSGKKEEYDKSLDWLEKLCGKLQIEPQCVWSTPGNHDVDRKVIESEPLVSTAYKELRFMDKNAIDDKIRQYFMHEKTARLLLSPIDNYINNFAAKFNCSIDVKSLYWVSDLTLNDASTLRLVGLNSTLISDTSDNDGDNKLILSNHQMTILQRQPGVEFLTLCHHPPSWLRDGEEIEEHLVARARIQLFGHKHSLKHYQINSCLRLTAGAAHPDRKEREWTPRYNVLELFVEGVNDQRKLVVRIYPRRWANKKFNADYGENGSPFHEYRLPLESWGAPVRQEKGVTTPAGAGAISIVEKVDCQVEPKGTDIMTMATDYRQLVYKFLRLPYTKRIAIAIQLDLLRDEDMGLQDSEKFRLIFQRAKESDRKIEELMKAIDKS